MKIIKRNGSEAVFDISKIIAAVTKANNVVASNQRLTKEQDRKSTRLNSSHDRQSRMPSSA